MDDSESQAQVLLSEVFNVADYGILHPTIDFWTFWQRSHLLLCMVKVQKTTTLQLLCGIGIQICFLVYIPPAF